MTPEPTTVCEPQKPEINVFLTRHETVRHFQGWRSTGHDYGPNKAEIFVTGAVAVTAVCLFAWSLLCTLHAAGGAR